MKVVGIDPAPGKGLHCFGLDLEQEYYTHFPVEEVGKFYNNLADDVLLCWDAPLTGPFWSADGKLFPKSFTKRAIERFFSTKNGYPTPQGISVQAYSGCSHWTISQYCLGLPRTSPRDRPWAEQQFQLVTENTPPTAGRHVVEVHPALALWLWCKEEDQPDHTSWLYKKDANIRDLLWEKFRSAPGVKETLSRFSEEKITPKNDDQFDAIISYVLGTLWLEPCANDSPSVVLWGDERTGALLLPDRSCLKKKFDGFVEKEYRF